MTNYEKIKAMPLEEMAKHIERLQDMDYTPFCKSDCDWDVECDIPESECIKCAEKWLKEEKE